MGFCTLHKRVQTHSGERFRITLGGSRENNALDTINPALLIHKCTEVVFCQRSPSVVTLTSKCYGINDVDE